MTPLISRMKYPAALALSLLLAMPPVSRAEGEEQSPLLVLSQKLDVKSQDPDIAKEAPQVRKDMADRFLRFMMHESGEGDGKTSYISSAVKKDEVVNGLKAMVQAWGESSFDDKNKIYTSGKDRKAVTNPVAHLYYVLGAGKAIPDDGQELPSWARKHPVLKDNLTGFGREAFLKEMAGFTKEGAQANLGEYPAGQLGGGPNQTKWVRGFLNAAAAHAYAVVADPRTKEDVAENVKKHVGENPVHEIGAGTGGDVSGNSRNYTTRELYIEGAEYVPKMYGPKDKTSRQISMKLVSVKTKEGIQDKIEVCDLTNIRDIFCQTFAINHRGVSSTAPLDDRTPGMRSYEFKMSPDEAGGNSKITFGRPGGTAIETDLYRLYTRRAEQASGMGRIKTINGKEFYSLGQGYPPSLVFFPVSIRGVAKDPTTLTPQVMAQTQEVINGRYQVSQGKPDLGEIDGKPFHLEFNKDTGEWNVVEGRGDKRMIFDGVKNVKHTYDPASGEWVGPKPTVAAGSEEKKEGSTPPSGVFSDVEAIRAVEEGIFSKMAGLYEPDQKLNEPLADELKKFIRFHKLTAAGEKHFGDKADQARYLIIVADESFAKTQNIYAPFPGMNGTNFKVKDIAVLEKRYLVTESNAGSLYMDLAQKGKDSVFKEMGTIVDDKGKNAIRTLRSGDLLADAMLRAGWDSKAPDTAVKNLAASVAAVQKRFVIEGTQGELVTVKYIDDSIQDIWPTLGKLEAPGDGYGKELKDNPFSAADGGPGLKIEETNKVGAGKDEESVSVYGDKAKFMSENAVLYVNAVEKGKGTKETPRRWYIQYKYKNYNGTTKQYENLVSAAKLLFYEDNEEKPAEKAQAGYDKEFQGAFPYDAKPELAINLDGITAHKAVETDLGKTQSSLRLVDRLRVNKERGVWAAFKTREMAPKDKAGNCLAPIAWWGMSKADAEEACREDSY